MSKKNPIIEVPKGLIKEREQLYHLNEEVIKYKNGKKPNPDREMYVTQTGRMFEVNENNILEEMHQTNHTSDPHGYKTVYFKDLNDGKYHKLKVHRAVLATFSPLPKKELDEMTVNHKKGKEKDNNNITNLEWMSISDNAKNSYDQGLRDILDDNGIRQVIKLARQGYSDEYIGKELNKAPITITHVRTGRGDYKMKLKKLNLEPVRLISTITEDIMREIIRLAKEGKSDREISNILGIPKASVKIIRGGREGYDEKLRKIGLEPVKTKDITPLTDDDYCEIMRLAKKGVPDEEIGAKFGRSGDTIKTIRNGRRCNKEILERLGLEPIKLKVRIVKK